MDIVDAFNIDLDKHELIAFVGAGGKTTAMVTLAQSLKSLHKSVLVTTTTNIYYPDNHESDEVIVENYLDTRMFQNVTRGTITALGSGFAEQNKLAGVDRRFIETLHQEKLFDYILVECDGAKRKPIKAPAFYEPIVPEKATKAIGVIGLDAFGNPIADDYVHRPEQFCAVTNRCIGETIDEAAVVSLILSPQGLFKGVPEWCMKYVLLNKADNSVRATCAGKILMDLLKKDTIPITCCLVGALAVGIIYP